MKNYIFSILLLTLCVNFQVVFAKEDFLVEENDFKKNLNSLSSTSYKKDNIDFSAQNISYNFKDETITATGKVTFISEGNTITSDTLYYNAKDDILYMKGNVIFVNENNHKIYSNEAIFDPKLNTGIIEKFKTIFADQSTMRAESVDKINEDTYNLNNMCFTACKIVNDYKPTWELKSQKAVYNETESKVVLYSSWLEVKGIPIFWTPYFSFSNLDFIRKSGFLTPKHEKNSLYGNAAIIPFYIPFGDTQDLLIETYAFLESKSLFLGTYKGYIENGSFYSSFSHVSSQLNKREIDEKERWHAFLNLEKNLSDVWRTNIKIEEASDTTYLRNYNIDKKDTVESFFTDKIEFEGFFSQNSYFDAYVAKFETINASFNTGNPTTDSIKDLNNAFNMNYSYFSDYSSIGKFNAFLNADNLFTKDKDTISRFVSSFSYKYYKPTLAGNYSFETLLQNIAYSDRFSENKFVEDNTSSNFATAITYEYPLLHEINDFVYSLSPVIQVSYAKNLDKNKNSFLIDSHSLNVNSNNLFELDHYQGFDQFEESKDLKYALKFSMLNDSNQGSRVFVGQRFRTGLKDNFVHNINEESASNYFVSLYLYPTSNIYLIYNGVIDKNFDQVETSFSLGYNNKLFVLQAAFDEYNQLDSTLYNVERISELHLNGSININKNIKLTIENLYDVSPSYKTEIKTSSFNFIWANDCLEIVFYTTKDYYTKEDPNTWGFRVNIKSIDGYKFAV